jgi:hypothetical protein
MNKPSIGLDIKLPSEMLNNELHSALNNELISERIWNIYGIQISEDNTNDN